MTPVPIRAAPAKSEKSKEKFPDLCGRAVAQSRQVRNLISPGADAGGNLITNAKKSEGRGACSNGKSHPPPARRGLFHYFGNALGQPTEIAPVQNKRHMRNLSLSLFDPFRCCCGCSVHIF